MYGGGGGAWRGSVDYFVTQETDFKMSELTHAIAAGHDPELEWGKVSCKEPFQESRNHFQILWSFKSCPEAEFKEKHSV